MDYLIKTLFPRDVIFCTSRFTEVEVASAIFRRTKNEDKARSMLHKIERPWKNKICLFPENPKVKVNLDDLVIKLVETALRYGTSFGDTVHANDAESYSIDYLVTWNGKDFKHLPINIKSLNVTNPSKMLRILKQKNGKVR
jgi:predicted nucleic acid-binding protein